MHTANKAKMMNLNRRATLKAAGAAGLISVLPKSLPAAHNSINKIQSERIHPFGIAELLIRLDGNLVTFSNLTAQTQRVRHFAPGSVQWKNHHTDLNAIRDLSSLTLAPYSSNTTTTVVHTRSERMPNSVWADDALLSTGNGNDTVLLGAFQFDNQLHVFPIPSVPQLT